MHSQTILVARAAPQQFTKILQNNILASSESTASRAPKGPRGVVRVPGDPLRRHRRRGGPSLRLQRRAHERNGRCGVSRPGVRPPEIYLTALNTISDDSLRGLMNGYVGRFINPILPRAVLAQGGGSLKGSMTSSALCCLFAFIISLFFKTSMRSLQDQRNIVGILIIVSCRGLRDQHESP
jgi:hypothetical protein